MNAIITWLGRFAVFKYVQDYLFSLIMFLAAVIMAVFVEMELGDYFILVEMTDAVLYAILAKYAFIGLALWLTCYSIRRTYRKKCAEEAAKTIKEEPQEQRQKPRWKVRFGRKHD